MLTWVCRNPFCLHSNTDQRFADTLLVIKQLSHELNVFLSSLHLIIFKQVIPPLASSGKWSFNSLKAAGTLPAGRTPMQMNDGVLKGSFHCCHSASSLSSNLVF
jgi:hypothetical protein